MARDLDYIGFEFHSLRTMPEAQYDQALQEQIAWDILQKHQGQDISEMAWVCHKTRVYYSILLAPKAFPITAVIKLIQNIFDQHIDHSFFILRNRIFTNVTLSESSQGMIKITAKRAMGQITARDHQLKYSEELLQVGEAADYFLKSPHTENLQVSVPEQFENVDQVKQALQRIQSKIGRGEVLHDHNREIAVIATDRDLRLLGWSANSNSKNKTLHAEVRLVQDFLQTHKELLPSQSKIFVTLKPCRMCAAMILENAHDPKSLEVYYLENDPGVMAQGTLLDKTKKHREGDLCFLYFD